MNFMLDREHNLVSLLCAIKSVLQSHALQVEENYFQDPDARMHHSEWALEQALRQAEKALSVAKRLGKAASYLEVREPGVYQTSLQVVWEKVLKTLESEWLIQRIEKVIRIPEDFPLLAFDTEDLEEVLELLVRNSIQAAETDKVLRPKLILRAEIGLSTAQKPVALITVADTGPGISRETLGQLFHPFFTTKPEGEGNGLGLYLVKSLMAKNGGRVAVSSYEHCGTTITLELNLA